VSERKVVFSLSNKNTLHEPEKRKTKIGKLAAREEFGLKWRIQL